MKKTFILFLLLVTGISSYSQITKDLIIKTFIEDAQLGEKSNNEKLYNRDSQIETDPYLINSFIIHEVESFYKNNILELPYISDKDLKDTQKTINWCKSLLQYSKLNDIEKEKCKELLDNLTTQNNSDNVVFQYWKNISNEVLLGKEQLKLLEKKTLNYAILQIFLSKIADEDDQIFVSILSQLPVFYLKIESVDNSGKKSYTFKHVNDDLLYLISTKYYNYHVREALKSNEKYSLTRSWYNEHIVNAIILLDLLNKDNDKALYTFIANDYGKFKYYLDKFASNRFLGSGNDKNNSFFSYIYEKQWLSKLKNNGITDLKNPIIYNDLKTLNINYYYSNVLTQSINYEGRYYLKFKGRIDNSCLRYRVGFEFNQNPAIYPVLLPNLDLDLTINKEYLHNDTGTTNLSEKPSIRKKKTNDEKMNMSLRELTEYEKSEEKELENEKVIQTKFKNIEKYLSIFVPIQFFKNEIQFLDSLDIKNGKTEINKLLSYDWESDAIRVLNSQIKISTETLTDLCYDMTRETTLTSALESMTRGEHLDYLYNYYNQLNLKKEQASSIFDSLVINGINKRMQKSIASNFPKSISQLQSYLDNYYSNSFSKDVKLNGEVFYTPKGENHYGRGELTLSKENKIEIEARVDTPPSFIRVELTGVLKKINSKYIFESNKGIFNLNLSTDSCGNPILSFVGTGNNSPIKINFNLDILLE